MPADVVGPTTLMDAVTALEAVTARIHAGHLEAATAAVARLDAPQSSETSDDTTERET